MQPSSDVEVTAVTTAKALNLGPLSLSLSLDTSSLIEGLHLRPAKPRP